MGTTDLCLPFVQNVKKHKIDPPYSAVNVNNVMHVAQSIEPGYLPVTN
jgi:hypothetical protein